MRDLFRDSSRGIQTAQVATLAILLLSDWLAGDQVIFSVPLRALALLGLLSLRLQNQAFYWWLLSAVLSYKTYTNWWSQDNHQFVFNLWCISLALGYSLGHFKEVIAKNAKALIGLSFAFATLWKVFLSPDFMNGDYFYFTFMTDIRFQDEAMILGATANDLGNNTSELYHVRNGAKEAAIFSYIPSLHWATLGVTWWTALIEGLLALVFLWPRKNTLYRMRNAVLLVFAWTTYLAAPVMTFGWTLITLGLAQTEEDEERTRLLYILTLVLLFIYAKVPMTKWLAEALL